MSGQEAAGDERADGEDSSSESETGTGPESGSGSDDQHGDVSAASSVQGTAGTMDRLWRWLLLSGNRMVVAVGIVAGVFALFFVLTRYGFLAIGPKSTAATAFASGFISGTLTLVTVALSINQLILSRVFGSPDELREELEGTQDLRDRVQRLADDHTSPNDPAEFLSVVARTVTERADRLRSAVEDADPEVREEIRTRAADIEAYGSNLEGELESRTSIVDVLGILLGTEYAQNMVAVEYLRNRHEGRVSETARAELKALEELTEIIAITRQFFKTLALQQNFARLSRLVAYFGFLALLTSVTLALVYRSSSVTVPPSTLPLVVSTGLALITAPLALFISYILRAATIARRTVSVGPFIPPEERSTEH